MFMAYELQIGLTAVPDYCKVRRLFQTQACWRTPSWREAVEERVVEYLGLLGGVR